MNRIARHLPALALAGLIGVCAGIFWYMEGGADNRLMVESASPHETQTGLLEATRERDAFKQPRYEYFSRLLRDPATGAIPEDIRARELEFASSLPLTAELLNPGKQAGGYDWQSAGPTDVGGRTRALGVDRRNPDILIAGGVSGGIWKSVDGGTTWDLKTPAAENLSVTDLAQHPGSPDTWYYVSGEISGNSASASGGAFYYGSGVFRSTDNGESWSRITPAGDNETILDDPFDIMSRVVVSPSTGSVFVCSNGYGVYRSTDGQNFENQAVLGNPVSMAHCDLTVTSTGTLFAALSTEKITGNANDPQQTGLFTSTDDGETWTDITPGAFPREHGRSVLATAPSDEEILYVLTADPSTEDDRSDTNAETHFFKINLAKNEVFDYSDHLPDFRQSGSGSGYMNLQGGYNMLVSVKPDDPNFVLVGGTNLFRSTDGFSSPPSGGYDPGNASQVDQYWIGGYNQDNSFSLYPNQHPDQHVAVFDPTDPDRMWIGTDGGVAVTEDLTAGEVSWTDRNSGYITSQFYTSAIPQAADDSRIMGGTQDNGTPFFRFPGGASVTSEDISLGDGGYAFFTPEYFYVSRQRGSIVKYETNSSGNPGRFDCVHPAAVDRSRLLFIHPYAVDPNDENVLYFPDENRLWRNAIVGDIDNNNPSCPGASLGWEQLHNASVPHEYTISALEVSRSPGNILFYAASSSQNPPLLKRLGSAKSSDRSPEDISIPGAPSGAWVKNLALNPASSGPGGIEAIAVFSNYNVSGVWHTTDSGETWEAIEGNLTGSSGNPGPSIRAAAILPTDQGPVYLLATSTGVYRTESLDGSNTVWGQEAAAQIGNAVTDHLDVRASDGDVAAGTHGRGMLYGDFLGSTDAPFITVTPGSGRTGDRVTIAAANFEFSASAAENEVFFNDTPAEVTAASATELQVNVPRSVLPRNEEGSTATLQVTVDQQTYTSSFEMLPPLQNAISQNFPNPFRGTTHIPLDLQQESRVTLGIYDVLGREIYLPHYRDTFQEGAYNIPIDLADKSSGTYVFRVVVEPVGHGGERFVDSLPMTLIK